MKLVVVSQLSIPQLQTHVETILDNARSSSVIGDRLAERGWTSDKIDELEAVFTDFLAAADAFDVLRREKDAVAARFLNDVRTFRQSTFRDHINLAGAALVDDAASRTALGLDDGVGAMTPGFTTWYPLAKRFYGRILEREDLQEALGAVNLTTEEAATALEEIERLQDLRAERNRLDAQRQQARQDRDERRSVLESELRRLQQVARVVLSDEPQFLEKLGYTAVAS
jgi:hypothetical protein